MVVADDQEIVRTGLRMILDAQPGIEIAGELHISLSTVKTHIASLMAKLGARNRVEVAMWAYETRRVDVGRGTEAPRNADPARNAGASGDAPARFGRRGRTPGR